MSKFTFALPDGKFFTLTGPADATIAQAEKIFLEQLAAGAFVGLRSGDALEPFRTEIVRFALSRLDRGTAGTADLPLLAITNEGVISALPVLSQTPPVDPAQAVTTADFAEVEPNAIRAVGDGPTALTPTQVRAIAAQAAAAVNQPASQSSQAKGVGKYGFSLPQLESAGILKPGTSCNCTGLGNGPDQAAKGNPPNFEKILGSPNVWTGKDNVRSLDDLLANEPLQDRVQQRLISSSYEQLVAAGAIQTPPADEFYPRGQVYAGGDESSSGLLPLGTALAAGAGLLALSGGLSSFNLGGLSSGAGNLLGSATSIFDRLGGLNIAGGGLSFEGLGGGLDKAFGSISSLAGRGAAELGGLLNGASKLGVDAAMKWAKGLTPDSLTNELNTLVKQGQFAVNFADFKLPTVASGMVPAAAFSGTVDRSTVDSATAKLFGTTRIPTPSFSPPSTASLNLPSLEPAMNSAKSLLASSSNLLGQAQALGGSLASSAGGLINQAQNALKAPGGVLPVPGLDVNSLARRAGQVAGAVQNTLPRLGSSA